MILAKLGMGLFCGTVVTGSLLMSEGMIRVRVREKKPGGSHLSLVVPALLAPAGLRCVPKVRFAEVAAKLRPWLPAIRIALDEMERGPEITYVEVTEPEEHVRIAKIGRAISVDVDDASETVHLSAPLRAVAGALEEIAAADPNT